MSKTTERYKLSPKARVISRSERRQLPPEAFEDRRTKVKISMYVDLDVLDHFKARASDGRPYQTQINSELRRIMDEEQTEAGDAGTSLRQAKGLIEAALRRLPK